MSDKRMDAVQWWHTELTEGEKQRLMDNVLGFPGRPYTSATGREIERVYERLNRLQEAVRMERIKRKTQGS